MAALITAAVFAGSVSGLTAGAAFHVSIDAPVGFTEVDDGGFVRWIAWDGKNDLPYTLYQKAGDVSPNLYAMVDYKFIYTGLAIPTDAYETYTEIYETYADQLDFEYVQSSTVPPGMSFYTEMYTDCTYVRMYDAHDADGNASKNSEDFVNKKNLLIQMCAELDDAGALEGTFYCPAVASGQYGWYDQKILVWNIPDGETEVLVEIVAAYDADTTISVNAETNGADDAVVYTIADI
ncbi:MAG: hypothetical protein LUC50_03935 [Ruminococcus sp.]|nr:hypothetical protein [Ruminococcus sp.]